MWKREISFTMFLHSSQHFREEECFHFLTWSQASKRTKVYIYHLCLRWFKYSISETLFEGESKSSAEKYYDRYYKTQKWEKTMYRYIRVISRRWKLHSCWDEDRRSDFSIGTKARPRRAEFNDRDGAEETNKWWQWARDRVHHKSDELISPSTLDSSPLHAAEFVFALINGIGTLSRRPF